jgi:DNA invertase Pin-like site-specific DNA recombinase
MIAAGYARVSTSDQAGGLEVQLQQLRAYAARAGWELREFHDVGVSGAKARRPGLDELLAAARQRQIKTIVITRLDRLARSLHHLVVTARELGELGVDLVVTEQAIDTTTSVGRLLFNVIGAIAEFERDLICERVRGGMANARARGTRFGRPRTFKADRDEVLARVAAGESYSSIAKDLGGHPTQIKRIVVRSLDRGLQT